MSTESIENAAPPGRIFGIIGYPLERTLSPVIQTAAFRARDLDWVYTIFRVPPGLGARAVEAMRTLGLGGLSVTIPHKESVVSAVDSLSPVAEAIKAVNTIAWTEDGESLIGDNTDVVGFVEGLRSSLGISLSSRRVVVLGAGGAARAVVWAALNEGVSSIVVASRNPSSAARVVEAVSSASPPRASRPQLRAVTFETSTLEEECARADLLVNATPVGSDGVGLPVPETAIHKDLYVYDLVYFPPRTPLVEVGARRGAGAAGGLEMLIFQGARQFEIWTGFKAPIEIMRRAAERAMRAYFEEL